MKNHNPRRGAVEPMIVNEDRFEKAGKRLLIARQAPVFIVLLIVGKDKEVNSPSHPLTSASGLAERVAKTPLGRPRGEGLYEGWVR
jgi:hypothetical protein